jgi:hypothetical protein
MVHTKTIMNLGFLILLVLLLIIILLQVAILRRLKPLPVSSTEKFAILVEWLNTLSFNRKAQIHIIDQRSFELYDETDPETDIVHFRYRNGTLKVSWTVDGRLSGPLFSCEYLNLEHVTAEQQKKLAEKLISERRGV